MTIERFLGCAESAKCHLSCDLSSVKEARVGSGHETMSSLDHFSELNFYTRLVPVLYEKNMVLPFRVRSL